MGMVLATPLVIPAGINLTGMAMGGESYYLYSLVGTLGGMLAGSLVANEVYTINSDATRITSYAILGLATLGGGVAGYHLGLRSDHQKQRRHSGFAFHLLPSSNSRGVLDGAQMGISGLF